MTRCIVLLFTLTLCCGCEPAATETNETKGSGGGTGIVGGLLLPPGDGGGGGAVAPQQNNPPQGGGAAPQGEVIQPLRPADLVDKRAAMAANRDLVEVTNDVNAGDYFTAVTGSIYSAVSRYTIDAINHDIELWKNLNENNEYPSFEEYKSILERHSVQLKGLRANQVYAYDQQTGSICILEDQNPDN